MNNIIKKDILRILTKINKALAKSDVNQLSYISNEINHNSSIFQDEDSLSLAVVVYSIFKIYNKVSTTDEKKIKNYFKKAKTSLDSSRYEEYRKTIQTLVKLIRRVDSRLKEFVVHVHNQAEIKKGSKLITNGISLARVAELMHISQWELMNYVGKTNISDNFDKTKDIKKRIEYARRLFVH
jgi:predicted transcriptional regulator